jgi:hypothetical protein
MISFTMAARYFDVITANKAYSLSETDPLALAKCEISHSELLAGGDEPWIVDCHHREALRVPSRSDIEDIERRSHFRLSKYMRRFTLLSRFMQGEPQFMVPEMFEDG